MNLLAFNSRGLGLGAAVGELHDLVRSYNPAVVLLSETKQKSKSMERLQWSMGFRHGVCVEGKGKGGGLALWWRDAFDVSVRPWCQYFIDAKNSSEAGTWKFTGIYGEPRTELRCKTWEALRFLRAQDDLPWLCAGDFNKILRQEEQLGLHERNEAHMVAFRECLTDCPIWPFSWAIAHSFWLRRRFQRLVSPGTRKLGRRQNSSIWSFQAVFVGYSTQFFPQRDPYRRWC